MPRCVVCERHVFCYRCRWCRSAYCSAACHKAHVDPARPGHCVGPRSPQLRGRAGGEREGAGKLQQSDDGEARGVKRGACDESFVYGERDEDGALTVLGEAHLSALAHNAIIRNKLKSSELQRLLRVIDSSRSRVDALEAAMVNTPEFKEFCDDVLSVIFVAEKDLKPRSV